MSHHSDVAPDTLGVELREEGVVVEYLDGRTVLYRGVPEAVEGSVTTAPGKDVHVLVTDASETQGVLVYVDERTTHDSILESSGVGRVFVEDGGRETLFPGVEVRSSGYRVTVDVDHPIDGRVFVFEEDEMSERSYEVVPGT